MYTGMEGEKVPAWAEQITLRGLTVSGILGLAFCLIVQKLDLTVGIVPSLNVAAGLLGYFLLQAWTCASQKMGFFSKPFTRQENTVVQTCVVACYGIAAYGGYNSFMLAMSSKIYNLIGPNTPGNRSTDVKELSLGWITAFGFTCSFVGLMALMPLRKMMILDYKLLFPSGTATAMLINSFHTTAGEETAKKQVNCLVKFFTGSFIWSALKWLLCSGKIAMCALQKFPLFGLRASRNTFYLDFSTTYIGIGLLCPHIVNFSVLLGAILSWGIMWPLITAQAGNWYPANLPKNDFRGLDAYKIFLGTALVLGDGFYNLVKIMMMTMKAIYVQHCTKQSCEEDITVPLFAEENDRSGLDNERKPASKIYNQWDQVFFSEGIPFWFAASGYLILSTTSIMVTPLLIPELKWYYVLICYLVAPVFGFCNSYAAGLTDFSLSNTYSKIALFAFAAWSGEHGGVVAGLAASGVIMSIISTASDLMQDIKTGYLTLSSPRSMFLSQLVGTLMGCIIAPIAFWVFWNAFDIGNPEGEYKSPSAVTYRQMAILGVEGLSTLPHHCFKLCIGFFFSAIGINILRDVTPLKVSQYLPIPVAIGIPFYIGAFFALDMFMGSLAVFVWKILNRGGADAYGSAVAAGLICGEGIWALPEAILALLKIKSPL